MAVSIQESAAWRLVIALYGYIHTTHPSAIRECWYLAHCARVLDLVEEHGAALVILIRGIVQVRLRLGSEAA